MGYKDKALKIAQKAHRGQRRKWGGIPYITHPIAVANEVSGDHAKAVAFLHDVIEDTDVKLDDIRDLFPPTVIEAVDAITKREGERYWDYIARVCENWLAKKVKAADLRHNMSTIPEVEKGLIRRWKKALEMVCKS